MDNMFMCKISSFEFAVVPCVNVNVCEEMNKSEKNTNEKELTQ